MKETISIGKINGSEITAIKAEDGTVLVPIKPICAALGVDVESQRKKINEDEDLRSTAVLSTAVGADGKEREMLCLPLRYVYGWMFTINPRNVAATARESVRKYRQQCYDILYDYFEGRSRRQQEFLNMERLLMQERKELDETLSSLMKSVSDVKTRIKNNDGKFAELQSERLNPTPSLFD